MNTATAWEGPFDLRPYFNEPALGRVRVHLKAGDVIWTQGDIAESLLYIETGWIKITSVQSSGREAVLGVRRPGEIIGTRSLIKHRPRLGTASALTDGAILRIDRNRLVERLDREPDFCKALLAYLVSEHALDLERMVEQLTQPVEKRLAGMLLRLDGDSSSNAHPLSQATLASMIGTTRPRVSHFMNKFRRRGYIDYNRSGHVRVREEKLKNVLAA
jgi:CRP/FNR family transcriptional regulator, cyclic AMP receptor protein